MPMLCFAIEVVKMTKDFEAYLKIDKNKYTSQYIIIINKKVVATGKDIVSMLKNVRKKYPTKTPFVAKIPEKSVLVL